MKDLDQAMSFDDVLCQHAKKSMLWISLLGGLGLTLISILNYQIDKPASLAYSPTILIFLTCLVIYLKGHYKSYRQYRDLSDAVAFCGVLGATVIVIRADTISFSLSTSPLQYALLICSVICFRRRVHGIMRNTCITFLSMLLIGIYSTDLLAKMYTHYVAGYFAGMMIFFISEDRMYKDFLYRISVQRERAESSRKYKHLHGELTNKCLPHQIDLILKGMSYQETMPTHRTKFWTSKFTLASDGEVSPVERHAIFEDYLCKLQEYMRNQYEFKYLPITMVGESHDSFEVRGPGYIANSGQETYTMTYDYPFPLPKNENKGQILLSTIFHQLCLFNSIVKTRDEQFSLILSITYGEGRGIFSGELSNYEVEGESIQFSDIYLQARKGIKDLKEQILGGNHALLIHPKVYKELHRFVPGFLEGRVKAYQFKPHIRNDIHNDTIYVLYIHRDDSEKIYDEISNWFRGVSYQSLR